jgi:hypothetical protein
MPGRLIAIEGPSGAGKTTATETAARRSGWTLLPEAYRRLTPTPALDFRSPAELVELERRLLEEDARRYTEARTVTRSGATVLADTGFLGPITYTWALVHLGAAPESALLPLLELARTLHSRGAWDLADAYVYLDTPLSELRARTRADPAGHPVALASRHAAVGAIERRLYLEQVAPRWGARFRVVSGDGPAEAVAGRVLDAAAAAVVPVPDAGSVEAVLALFEGSERPSTPSRGNR